MPSHAILSRSLAILPAALLASCGPPPQAPHGAFPPPAVSVSAPQKRMVAEWDEFTGRIDAIESVEVKPRVSGYLQEVKVKSGDVVKKGDVLFVIDPRWAQAEFQRAEATVAQAQARFDTAQREANRAAQLEASKAISAEEAESRRSALTASKGALDAALAARDFAKLELDNTSVFAPISGRVSRALLTVGNHVSGVPGFTTTLTTIVSADPVYVYTSVDEASFLKYQRLIREKKLPNPKDGKVPAEVRLEGEEGFPHKGFIESFDNRIDPTTGSIALRTIFPNPNGTLVPGGFARVRIPASTEYEALLVEEKIIGTDQSQKFVLTVGAGNLAEYKSVTLGATFEGLRVIKSGLKAQDQLITSGLQLLRPGMPVMPLPPGSSAPASPPSAVQ